MDRRTRVLLEAPIAPTLLRLALPNILVLAAQAAAGLIETYFIGKLGTQAAFGLINAAAVAGGAWFGPLRWPFRKTVAAGPSLKEI